MSHMIRLFVLAMALCIVSCGGDDEAPADAASCTPGQTEHYAACTDDSDCTSCLCHSYGMAGQLCSKPCISDNDCEAPSPGCNMMGVCKRPQ